MTDNDNQSTSGGAALLTSHSFPTAQLHIQTQLQAVAVRNHLNILITVCTLYLPPSLHITTNSLDKLIDQLPQPFILICDLNGHGTCWVKQTGKFLLDNNLCLMNHDKRTYFPSQ